MNCYHRTEPNRTKPNQTEPAELELKALFRNRNHPAKLVFSIRTTEGSFGATLLTCPGGRPAALNWAPASEQEHDWAAELRACYVAFLLLVRINPSSIFLSFFLSYSGSRSCHSWPLSLFLREITISSVCFNQYNNQQVIFKFFLTS